MNAAWALCMVLSAIDGTTSPLPPEPVSHLIPESLTRLLTAHPELTAHHQGYLKELAKRPALKESETAWWQAISGPALRNVAARFEESLALDSTARYRFNMFYDAMARSPELRSAVENLLRTEMEAVGKDRALTPALQFLRANPDIALRFLKDPRLVRPLPPALEARYAYFEQNPDWARALWQAYDTLAQLPDGHLVAFPWWRQLAALLLQGGDGANLEAALYRTPDEYWLWHLRNINLVADAQAEPWVRYWQRLIQREPDLAREYGPFITRLLQDPEKVRQHLIDLQDGTGATPAPWPPDSTPPALAPLAIDDPVETMKRGIERPTIERPERPTVERPLRPKRPVSPTRPTPPDRPTVEPSRSQFPARQ